MPLAPAIRSTAAPTVSQVGPVPRFPGPFLELLFLLGNSACVAYLHPGLYDEGHPLALLHQNADMARLARELRWLATGTLATATAVRSRAALLARSASGRRFAEVRVEELGRVRLRRAAHTTFAHPLAIDGELARRYEVGVCSVRRGLRRCRA